MQFILISPFSPQLESMSMFRVFTGMPGERYRAKKKEEEEDRKKKKKKK